MYWSGLVGNVNENKESKIENDKKNSTFFLTHCHNLMWWSNHIVLVFNGFVIKFYNICKKKNLLGFETLL